jgi:hypothetical protein
MQFSAQNEGAKWFFGEYAGLDFMTTPPTILTGSMVTQEGCSSISDGAGNLLFYTDGSTVWDKNHNVMSNGTGLLGNFSTTQSGVIVKKPGSASLYYIFTQDASGNSPLNYSIVDITLAAGNGSVTTKNVLINSNCTEKLTAVKHCNGVDIWVLSHSPYNTNTYRAYLLTATGLNMTPVLTTIGVTNASVAGYLRTSPDGKKIGVALYNGQAIAELYDFDNSTGIISNAQVLGGSGVTAYGCEFSSDGTKLYAAGINAIYQWDLCAGTSTAIAASMVTIPCTNAYGLQLAIDGKIYVARYLQTMLGVINNPNVAGTGCNYVDLGQSTAPNVIRIGLPNFITSGFKSPPPPFTYTLTCSTVSFSIPQSTTTSQGCSVTSTLTSFKWDFGDPGSGALNSSTLSNPSHVYAGPGTYSTYVVLYYPCSTDTVKQSVVVLNSTPSLSVTGTSTMCVGEKRRFVVSGASSYSWSVLSNTASATPSIILAPVNTTTYMVTGITNGCSGTKTFVVSVSKCTDLSGNPIQSYSLRMYPNPVQDELYVENGLEFEMSIMDGTGAIIFEGKYRAGEHVIDTRTFEYGFYTVRLKDSDGVSNLRFVKVNSSR